MKNVAIGLVKGIAFLNHEDGSISRVYFKGDLELTNEERKADQIELEQAYSDAFGRAPLMKLQEKEKKLYEKTPEERISEYVEEIASRHLAEMKSSWRFKNHPGFIAQEASQPYRCETCGSTSVNMCIGWRCAERHLSQSTASYEQREMPRRSIAVDLSIARKLSAPPKQPRGSEMVKIGVAVSALVLTSVCLKLFGILGLVLGAAIIVPNMWLLWSISR